MLFAAKGLMHTMSRTQKTRFYNEFNVCNALMFFWFNRAVLKLTVILKQRVPLFIFELFFLYEQGSQIYIKQTNHKYKKQTTIKHIMRSILVFSLNVIMFQNPDYFSIFITNVQGRHFCQEVCKKDFAHFV